MNAANTIATEGRAGQGAALQFGLDFGDDSSKIFQRAIWISIGIHLVVIISFLTIKIPVYLQRIHQTRIVNYQEVKTIFQEASKTLPIMDEAKATTTREKSSALKKVSKRKPVTRDSGLLKLDLVNSPLTLIELPAPTVPGAKVSKLKGVEVAGAISSQEGPIRLVSLEHISAKAYKGGLADSLRVSDKTQVSIERKEVEVRGGLEDAVVRRIIEERLPAIRICYETALLTAPELQGEIVLSWTVQPQGLVSDVMAESKESSSEDLQTCLKERVAQWKFPEPKGGGIVNIRYPFVFRKVNG